MVSATQTSGRAQIPDKVLMYASLFSYESKERITMNAYQINFEMIGQFEGKFADIVSKF